MTFHDFACDQGASTLVEYALISALVAIACIVVFSRLGSSVVNVFTVINANLSV